MEQNPYAASLESNDHGTRDRNKVLGLRVAVGCLIVVLIFQWICHFFTAVALHAYIGSAKNVGPTARTLDSSIYGIICVVAPAVLSGVASLAAFAAIRKSKTV